MNDLVARTILKLFTIISVGFGLFQRAPADDDYT